MLITLFREDTFSLELNYVLTVDQNYFVSQQLINFYKDTNYINSQNYGR